jgi:hypothetical protein
MLTMFDASGIGAMHSAHLIVDQRRALKRIVHDVVEDFWGSTPGPMLKIGNLQARCSPRWTDRQRDDSVGIRRRYRGYLVAVTGIAGTRDRDDEVVFAKPAGLCTCTEVAPARPTT